MDSVTHSLTCGCPFSHSPEFDWVAHHRWQFVISGWAGVALRFLFPTDACTGVRGNATATTKPVPPCFNGGPECVKDTTCQTHLKTPCCSGRSHFTAGYGS